ncbi:hypothetical protein [Clostridium sp.]|uniref:hypothetical protein n=1 Tax=Clostridium sp. TaxID=1506 RepID=UPI003F2C9AC8
MDNLREMRNKLDNGKYNLTLEVSEAAYFATYDNVDLKSGEELVRNYLRGSSDDACFNNIEIKYNENRHTVKITAELEYDKDIHRDYSNRGKLM